MNHNLEKNLGVIPKICNNIIIEKIIIYRSGIWSEKLTDF